MTSHLNVFYHFLSLVLCLSSLLRNSYHVVFMSFQLPLIISMLPSVLSCSFLYGCSSTLLILTPNFLQFCDQQHHCRWSSISSFQHQYQIHAAMLLHYYTLILLDILFEPPEERIPNVVHLSHLKFNIFLTTRVIPVVQPFRA